MQVVSELELESRDLLPSSPVDDFEGNMQLDGIQSGYGMDQDLVYDFTSVIGWSKHVKTENIYIYID